MQVHRAGGEVRAFARSLDDITAWVTEVVEAVLALPVWSVVLA
jgi:ATP-dependent DNA ligase